MPGSHFVDVCLVHLNPKPFMVFALGHLAESLFFRPAEVICFHPWFLQRIEPRLWFIYYLTNKVINGHGHIVSYKIIDFKVFIVGSGSKSTTEQPSTLLSSTQQTSTSTSLSSTHQPVTNFTVAIESTVKSGWISLSFSHDLAKTWKFLEIYGHMFSYA